MGTSQARLKSVHHGSGLQGWKAGASWVCNEAVCTAHWTSAELRSLSPPGLGDGGSHLYSFPLVRIPGLRLAWGLEFFQARGFYMSSYVESRWAAPGCPLLCPILSSLSQLQAA